MSDEFDKALKRYSRAFDAWKEQRERMAEELRFSNPADPQQWDQKAKQVREAGPAGARPCLTLDHTNQYIAQVVNDARQNSPAIHYLPATSGAREEVAKALEGIARHIEYRSRAQIAYDTALEHAARCSVGWFRLIPEVVDEKLNYQEVRIARIHDPLSVTPSPDWTEPDGTDMQYCFIEYTMSKEAFKERWPDADATNFRGADTGSYGWWGEDSVKVCEYFERIKTERNMLIVEADGVKASVTEDKHAAMVAAGGKPAIVGSYRATDYKVIWRHMSGVEFLEESEFPSCYMPIFPIIGNEVWVDGKRFLAGMTRKMMWAQRAYNYERSAWVEAVALQPKAPWDGPAEAFEGHEQQWGTANTVNHSYMAWNAFDQEGRPLPRPQRQQPPALPAAFAQGAQFAEQDLQASVGMFKASLGAPTQEHSGRAILAKQREGDTANFHFQDNQSRTIEQAGRVMLDMICRLYDEPREARILGLDNTSKAVKIDKNGEPYAIDGDITTINPTTGTYDVRVQTGPAYTTLRSEAAEGLTQMINGNPAIAAVVAPIWARMQDWPEADKLSKALLAMAPEPVRQAMADDATQGETVDGLKAKLQQAQQQMQQMNQMMAQAAEHITQLQSEQNQKELELLAKLAGVSVQEYDAETKRLTALGTALKPEDVAAIAQQAVQQALMREPLGDAEHAENVVLQQMGLPDADPMGQGMEQDPGELAEPMEQAEPQEPEMVAPPKAPEEMSDDELLGELQ